MKIDQYQLFKKAEETCQVLLDEARAEKNEKMANTLYHLKTCLANICLKWEKESWKELVKAARS